MDTLVYRAAVPELRNSNDILVGAPKGRDFTVPANLQLQTVRSRCGGGSFGITKLRFFLKRGGEDQEMKSAVVKRSVVIAGHKTSISLEDVFWGALRDIAAAQHRTLGEMVATIDANRQSSNLSSAIRVFVLIHHLAGSKKRPKTEAPPPTK
jgi:predicted DNA-binding ribbon-helix-helix protein